MPNIIYRQASLTDLQLLIDSRVAFLSEYWGQQPEILETNLRKELALFFEKEIQSQTYICWLALHEGELVGVGGMKISQRPGSFRVPDGRSGYIMNMYTLPAFRRQGIAKTILEKLITSGKAMGLHFFELHATKDGELVYQQNGFELHKEPTYRKFEA